MKRIGHAITLTCLLLLPCRPAAGEWTADIVDMEWSPQRFVAVDKRAQSFALMTRQSPLKVLQAIPCATGQELGDKFKEGDLKTPEGVYFITRRKSTGLNYELYGDLAFPLNFPNPADVLRRKSGHGIWIHGRGHALIPFETQGCVALSTPDIHRVDGELAEGMPVVIADEIRVGGDAARLASEAREVVEATQGWAKAWQDRSDAFFGFHDPEKFAITEGQPFAAFRSHKERLFKALPWIQVTLSDVRAIPGPDYWVTYFVQVYRSPTLISQGIKRLYWQRAVDGKFRIIGMEYEEVPVTVADKGGRKTKATALADEAETDTTKPDAPSEEEVQVRQLVDAHQAVMEKVAQKAFHSLKLKNQPTPEDQAILEVAQTGALKPGVSPFASDAMTPAPAAPVQGQGTASVPEKPAVAAPATPAPEISPAATALATAAAAAVAHGAPVPPTVAVATLAAKPAVPAASVQPATAPAAASNPAPAKVAPVAAERAAEITAALEDWRSAWERGRLDDYIAHYADNAVQGSLRGKEAIRKQKAGVWRGREPGRVGIEVVSITPNGDGYTVVCAEKYQGKSGHSSQGFKTINLALAGQKLVITGERWSKNRPTPVAVAPVQTAAVSTLVATPAKTAPLVATAPTPAAAPVSPPSIAPVAPVVSAVPTVAPVPAKPEPVKPAPTVVPPAVPAAPVQTATTPAAASNPAPAKTAPVAADRAGEIAAMLENWRSDWEHGRLDDYIAHYANNAVQGSLRGKEAIRKQKAGVWRGREPGRVGIEVVSITPNGDGYTVVCAEKYQGKSGHSSEGFKTMSLVPAGQGFVIAGERWSKNRPAPQAAEIPGPPASRPVAVAAAPTAVSAAPVPPIVPTVPAKPEPAKPTKPEPTAQTATAPSKAEQTAAVNAMVDSWRSAWERGRVQDYAAFYADNAVQGDRRGRKAIREQKVDLWKDKAPKRVVLSDLKITPRKNGFVVTCIQEYESRDGVSERGRKTLYLAPSGSGFAIVEEKWSRM